MTYQLGAPGTVAFMFLDGKLSRVESNTEGVLWDAATNTIDEALANPTVALGLLQADAEGSAVDLAEDAIRITPPFHVPFGGATR